MKYTDCKQGGIYYSGIYNGYLLEIDRIDKTGVYVKTWSNSGGFHNNATIWGQIRDLEVGLREATYEELEWYLACKQAGKTVEHNKIIAYDIY